MRKESFKKGYHENTTLKKGLLYNDLLRQSQGYNQLFRKVSIRDQKVGNFPQDAENTKIIPWMMNHNLKKCRTNTRVSNFRRPNFRY